MRLRAIILIPTRLVLNPHWTAMRGCSTYSFSALLAHAALHHIHSDDWAGIAAPVTRTEEGAGMARQAAMRSSLSDSSHS